MFDNQAKEVLELVKQEPSNEEMKSRWQDAISDYPPVIKNLMIMHAKRIGLEYINKNCPKAWFRPLFLPKDELDKFLAEEK